MRLIGRRSCCRLSSSSSSIVYYLSVIGALLFATIVLEVNTWQFPSFNIQVIISKDPPNNNTSALQCLDLNLNQELDYMISRARLIYVTVPAKAGGTSMNQFTKRCGDTHIREYQDGKPFAFIEEDEYKDLLDKQIGVNSSSIITSHITCDTSLIHLSKGRSNERVLIIYIHRDEEERTISGIKMIADHMCKTSVFSDIEMGWYAQSVIAKNTTHCIIDEESMGEFIARGHKEVGGGSSSILTRALYDALQFNHPEFVFVHYKQVDKLQTFLAKHHCPGLLDELPIRKKHRGRKAQEDLLSQAQR